MEGPYFTLRTLYMRTSHLQKMSLSVQALQAPGSSYLDSPWAFAVEGRVLRIISAPEFCMKTPSPSVPKGGRCSRACNTWLRPFPLRGGLPRLLCLCLHHCLPSGPTSSPPVTLNAPSIYRLAIPCSSECTPDAFVPQSRSLFLHKSLL